MVIFTGYAVERERCMWKHEEKTHWDRPNRGTKVQGMRQNGQHEVDTSPSVSDHESRARELSR